ncbi:chromate transporter [Treponema saccharophilum]|uniref:chromate transporter n=1 Tax=Treponema saccharophilum TaxID=165 RepID=UPI00386C7968
MEKMQQNDGTLGKRLLGLFTVFFKIGLCTFGGGIAMLSILERELTEKRGWTTSDELLDYFAIGQSTPGIIAVNVSTFVGHKRAGIPGGIVATAGMVCPSVIIITIIAEFISNFAEIAWVQRALTGINVAVAALLTQAVWKFASKAVSGILGAALLVAAFVLIFALNVGTIWIIIGSALAGVAIAGARGEFRKEKAE